MNPKSNQWGGTGRVRLETRCFAVLHCIYLTWTLVFAFCLLPSYLRNKRAAGLCCMNWSRSSSILWAVVFPGRGQELDLVLCPKGTKTVGFYKCSAACVWDCFSGRNVRSRSNWVAEQGYSLWLSLLLEYALCFHWYISRFTIVITLGSGLLSFSPEISSIVITQPAVLAVTQFCINYFRFWGFLFLIMLLSLKCCINKIFYWPCTKKSWVLL